MRLHISPFLIKTSLKPFLLSFLFICVNANLSLGQSTEAEWALSGKNKTEIVGDEYGNAYVCRIESNYLYLYNSQGTDTLSNGSPNYGTQIIQKFNPSGHLVWSIAFTNNWPAEIKINQIEYKNGFIYLHGQTQGQIDFDPGPDTSYALSYGWFDTFIAKYDIDGNFIWVKTVGGIGSDPSGYLAIDEEDNVTIVSQFGGSVDLNPDYAFDALHTSNQGSFSRNYFILKLDKNGRYLWSKTIQNITVKDIENQPNGNLLITGTFSNSADFDPGPNTVLLTSSNFSNFFLLQLDNNGQYIFAYANESRFTFMTTDVLGNIYLTGRTQRDVDLDPKNTTFSFSFNNSAYFAYILKLDPSLNLLWAKQFQATPDAINVDKRGNINIFGQWTYTDDLDPGPAHLYPPIAFGHGLFLQQLDNNGNFIEVDYVQQFMAASVSPSMFSDSEGNIYIGSKVSTRLYFDAFHPYLPSTDYESFIVKYHNASYDTNKAFLKQNLDINIFPNPTSNYVYIDTPYWEEAHATIYDNTGHLVYSKILEQSKTLIDISDYPKGIYNVTICYNNTFETKKIVKN